MPSRSRILRKEQERQASLDRLQNEPRSPLGVWSGVGAGRIQLIHLPSFSKAHFWQICESNSEWLLFSSEVLSPSRPTLMVKGYDRISFDSDQLHGFFRRLTALALPIAPDFSKLAGLDGAVTYLTLSGDLHSQVRFAWWSEYPPAWKPLVDIANEMLEAFSGATPIR